MQLQIPSDGKIKKTIAPHRCIGCDKMIEVGESARYWENTYDDENDNRCGTLYSHDNDDCEEKVTVDI